MFHSADGGVGVHGVDGNLFGPTAQKDRRTFPREDSMQDDSLCELLTYTIIQYNTTHTLMEAGVVHVVILLLLPHLKDSLFSLVVKGHFSSSVQSKGQRRVYFSIWSNTLLGLGGLHERMCTGTV